MLSKRKHIASPIKTFGKLIIVIILITAFLLSACSSPTPLRVEVTRVVPQTVVVTQIIERVVTATALPASPTPAPTLTPQQTPTPVFVRWTSDQVVDAFNAAGLEAESTRPMTKDDYGFGPMVAIEGTRFLIPSICSVCGGRILGFASQEDLEKTRSYYIELGKESAAFFSWTFIKDNILVQINGDLPEEKARQYEAALKTLN